MIGHMGSEPYYRHYTKSWSYSNVDFKIYNEKIKPLDIEADFNLAGVEGFIIGWDGLYLMPKKSTLIDL